MTQAGNRQRNNELAMIHIGAKAIGLDPADKDPNSDYRAMLWVQARVRSSADLDYAGRAKVLNHLKASGWNGHKNKPTKAHKGGSNLMSKIEAQLADMQLPWKYAISMGKRMFGRDKLEFCKPFELQKIVAALAYEQKKRALLQMIDSLLLERGKTRDDLTRVIPRHWPDYKKDWQRDMDMMNAILDLLVKAKNGQDQNG